VTGVSDVNTARSCTVRIKHLIAAAAIACAAGVGTASSASAAPDDGVCDVGELCYFFQEWHTGSVRGDFAVSAGDVDSYSYSLREKMRSVINLSDRSVMIYTEPDFQGESFLIPPWTGYTQMPDGFRKNTNSHRIILP
jgi:Peptidase inhibitor family I36